MNRWNQVIFDCVEEAETEIHRFLKIWHDLRTELDTNPDAHTYSKLFARLKRQSHEVSRAMVEIRKGTW